MDERIALTVIILCVLFSVGKAQNPSECDTLPSDNTIKNNILNFLAEDGETPNPMPNLLNVNYTCMAQGMSMGSYREVSVIVRYSESGSTESNQFDLQCVTGGGGSGWQAISGSFEPAPDGFVSLETRTNCSQCRESANNDHDCVGKGLCSILPLYIVIIINMFSLLSLSSRLY